MKIFARSAVLVGLLQLTGCGGSSSSTSPTPLPPVSNSQPIYVDGLQASYQGLIGDEIQLGTANFTDANNDTLTTRYFMIDSEGQRTNLDDNRFVCAADIVSVGAQASDSEFTIDSPLSTVDCFINHQQVLDGINSNKDALAISNVHTGVNEFELDNSLIASISQDLNADGLTDVVLGIGYQCQQSAYDNYNATPFMPAHLASVAMYDVYPQHLICLSESKTSEMLIAQLTQAIQNAAVADLLVMGPSVQSHPEKTVLLSLSLDSWQSGKVTVNQNLGALLLLGEHSQGSIVTCTDQEIRLKQVSIADPAYPRLKRFEFAERDLPANLSTASTSDCTIVNRTGVTSQLPQSVAVQLQLSAIEAKQNLNFEVTTINAIDNAHWYDTGNVNGDERTDIVTFHANQLSWFNNISEDQFGPRVAIANLSSDAVRLKLADLDSDGLDDIVLLHSDKISWMRNNQGQGFEAEATLIVDSFSVFNFPYNKSVRGQLIMFDANGDGRPDILTTTGISDNNKLSVYYNTIDGFTTEAILYSENDQIRSVRVADFDLDGRADIVIGGENLTVLRTGDDGSLAEPQTFALEGNMTDFVVADIDGDNKAEVIISRAISVELYRQTDSQTLEKTEQFRTGRIDNIFGASLWEGFGQLQLLKRNDTTELYLVHVYSYSDIGASSYSEYIEHIRFNADGTHQSQGTVKDLGGTDLKMMKLNHSGLADLLVINRATESLGWVGLDSHGAMTTRPKIGNTKLPLSHSVTTGKLDSDDKADIVITGGMSSYGEKSQKYVNSWTYSAGQLKPHTGYQLTFETPPDSDIFYVDNDGDGDLDVIYQHQSVVYTRLNNGSGFDQTATVLFSDNDFELQQLVDIDGDGDIDYSGSGSDAMHSTYLTSAQNIVQGPSIKQTNTLVELVDLNNDGHLDVVAFRRGTDFGFIEVYLFNGTDYTLVNSDVSAIEHFYLPKRLSRYLTIKVLDINDDGHPDIVFNNYSAQTNEEDERFIGLAVSLNDGQGQFLAATFISQKTESSYTDVTLGDFNGDGQFDLIVSSVRSSKYQRKRHLDIYLRQNDGALVLDRTQDISRVGDLGTWDENRFGAIGDINNDGRDDIVLHSKELFGAEEYEDYFLLTADSQNGFVLDRRLGSVLGSMQTLYSSAVLVDHDNDADKDIVLVIDGFVKVFENK